jgi:hypothetical protein
MRGGWLDLVKEATNSLEPVGVPNTTTASASAALDGVGAPAGTT